MKKSVWAFTVLFGCGMIHYTSTTLNDEVKNDIVRQQNSLRRGFAFGFNGGPSVANMAKLSWSTHLESVAQETLEVKCALDRSPLTDSLSQISWNSNVKINSNGNFTGDILSWFEEIQTTLFFPDVFSCFPYNACLQAYTLLDASHKLTGCSFKRRCRDNMSVFLCLYDKDKLNRRSNFFSPGPLCTKCDNVQSFCDNGLCVHCNPEVSTCDCRKTCQRPGVGNGTLNMNTCVCTCVSGLGPNCDEPCRNPEIFMDYDICETVRREECEDPYQAEMLAHYCPEQCVCGRTPVL